MKPRLGVVACAYLMVLIGSMARADTLDEIRKRGSIRWGGDQEGGGPYIYSAPNDPQKLIGFEVELMQMFSERLGVRSEFHQCEWDNLPNLLGTGDIDVIVNGYELTKSRLARMDATVPYYVYELQLLARRDDQSIQSWDDLGAKNGHRKVVGVLGGTAAQNYVEKRFGDQVVVRIFPGSTQAMGAVVAKDTDATVQDVPIAQFYRNRYPSLQFVDRPVAPGYYVIYLRQHDDRLREELNTGLLDLIRTGKMRKLYERYGLWNDVQEKLGTPNLGFSSLEESSDESGGRSEELHGWAVIGKNLGILLEAAGMTILLTCLAMPLAIGAGLLVALGRLYGPAPLRWLFSAYVEILRGTPLLLQLVTIYYVLPPAFGFSLNPVLAAVLGLAVNYSAYESEIYRAGLLAVPVGQMEAALSLGMSRAVALRRVIVPQAVRLVIPPVTNDFIALFKDTSMCSVITVVELTKRYLILVNNTNAFLELMVVTALLYLMMSYPLSLLARRLERRTPRVAV
jgi:polar amino acid transport system substrate-binding protein